ncbi:unnamed protein product [Auanema sp. JU1783]|nr:unnamed protein product [Auanema sp. JU1783]
MTAAATFWDVAEPVVLCDEIGLYLCSLAKVIIYVKLQKILVPGQSISNWDIIEKLKKAVNPIQLFAIKVTDSTLESVTFEAELISQVMMFQALRIFNDMKIKMSGFSEPFLVSAEKADSGFPTSVSWDKYFLNRGDMNTPGRRADTIYLANIPCKWFAEDDSAKPSETLLKKALSKYGSIRAVDIPNNDIDRLLYPVSISGVRSKRFSFDQDLTFECYVQYEECEGFENAMKGLRDMKWFKKTEEKVYQANIKVEFDKSFHLSSELIKKRESFKENIVQMKLKKAEAEKQKLAEELDRQQREKEEKEAELKKKEERRVLKKELDKKKREEDEDNRVKLEEMKVKKAERLAQSERLLEDVFDRLDERENIKRLKELKDRKEMRELTFDDQMDASAKEEKLRKLLLLQQEQKMREMLKKKLSRRRSRSRSSDSNSEYENRRRKKKKKSSHRRSR